MPLQERYYKDDGYLFPDPDLLGYSAAQLRTLIHRELPTALFQIDGTGGITPVHVDYAQDLIEQARDLLLDQGETFSPEDVERLSFLSWPVSTEEQAKQEALQQEDAARAQSYSLLNQVRSRALETARKAMLGRLVPDSPGIQGIELVIGKSGHRSSDPGPSGAEVMEMVARLHALGAPTAKLGGYVCSRGGVTFETDPLPAWSVSMDLPTQTTVWAFLIQWHADHQILQPPHIDIAWEDEGIPRKDWVTLAELWTDQSVVSELLLREKPDQDAIDQIQLKINRRGWVAAGLGFFITSALVYSLLGLEGYSELAYPFITVGVLMLFFYLRALKPRKTVP